MLFLRPKNVFVQRASNDFRELDDSINNSSAVESCHFALDFWTRGLAVAFGLSYFCFREQIACYSIAPPILDFALKILYFIEYGIHGRGLSYPYICGNSATNGLDARNSPKNPNLRAVELLYSTWQRQSMTSGTKSFLSLDCLNSKHEAWDIRGEIRAILEKIKELEAAEHIPSHKSQAQKAWQVIRQGHYQQQDYVRDVNLKSQ
ncbi:hypothetical protein T459_07959 [Capsicum annuum]|uniref:Uncharacterized protein n=1 Tax=Capsicum annuum TaxID=4072 RepID=A0A2G2ZV49_CAPAN|nr:hypothetical protein FXO37_27776 [Capsicum annuum]PHT85853.1 hypothetical protein T459_07959 [Capsicum annuum]